MLILGFAIMVGGQSQPAGVLLSQQELMQRMQNKDDLLLIDVRTAGEFAMGHVPGAVNIPHTDLADRLGDVRPHHGQDIIVYCESGRRADMAKRLLRQAGLDRIRHLDGDMLAWRQAKLPIEKAER
jgi:rhodanese-related sulfurtransferase